MALIESATEASPCKQDDEVCQESSVEKGLVRKAGNCA